MEGGKSREQRLHEAALEGSVPSLDQLLIEDPLILHRIKVGCLTHTPLHVAAYGGKLAFVKRILEKNPALAGVLDKRRWSPLHLASAQGYHEIVKALTPLSPEMCISLDGDGRNPLHLAAMKGEVNVLEALLGVGPYTAHELLNAKDGEGNTILHLAVKNKKFETVKHLLKIVENTVKAKNAPEAESAIKAVNAVNTCGYTALDILIEIEKAVPELDNIKGSFRKARALRAKDLREGEWLSKKRDTLMVVAVLLATMAFQAGVSPPGGFWQDDSKTHRAGEAIMAYNYPQSYPYFLRTITVGFVASISTILLLITGWPFKKKLFMWIMVMIMWLTITSVAFTYAFAITVVTPKQEREPLTHTIVFGGIAWFSVMVLLLVAQTIRLINKWLKTKDIHMWLQFKEVFKFSSGRQGQGKPLISNVNLVNSNHANV